MDEIANNARDWFDKALHELPLLHPGRTLAALGLAMHAMAEKERAEAEQAHAEGAIEQARYGMAIAVSYAGTEKACMDAIKHIANDDERRKGE